MIGIYKITSPTKKVYIGQSVDVDVRFKKYKFLNKAVMSQSKLYRSFIKYGVDKHLFEILEECLESELNEKERYYQDLYSAIGKNGLNCRLTKTTDRSGRLSEETRLKMSVARKGIKLSDQTRMNMSLARKGVKLKNTRKGYKPSEEAKKNMSKAQLGKKRSKEHVERMRESMYKNVINVKTGEIYKSCKHISDKFGINKQTLQKKLSKHLKNNTDYEYLINYNNKKYEKN